MALVRSFGLLVFLGLAALLFSLHFVLRSEESAEYQALRKRLDAVEALRAEEAAEQEALEQRLEAVEALLRVLKSVQSKDVKEAADAAASKAAARAANKTRLKVKRFAKAHAVSWREDHKCGHQGLLPNGEPAQCNPKSDAPCCSPGGWCGGSADHCSCSTCIDYRITAAAPAEPYNLEAPKRIAIVVPFRDRGAHLEKFRERIQSHISAWIKKGINHSWKVFVVEQFDEQLFNRGYLFNVGFQFASSEENTLGKFDCVVMHDIDILPTPVVDYGWCIYPNQLSGEIECWGWGVPYPDNVGGVVSMSPTHWRGINGFSNEYDGWGGEDDDLYLRLKQNSLLKGGCHTWCKDRNKPTVPMVRRPPLGEGRMTCLHDGDHTPRQRAPQDAPMWQRLNAMKGGSKRWLNDGLSSLKFFSAGDALESEACKEACPAPEDPEKRVRLFSEHWSRVSSKTISNPQRVEVVRLPGSHGCGNISRPLPVFPAGLLQMRELLPKLFSGHCDMGEVQDWAHKTNFILIDLSIGQALLVGTGVELVTPDSSLGSFKDDGSNEAAPALQGSDYLLQAQRLSRWLRKLPNTHRGWIVVADEALSLWQQRFVRSGRRYPLLSPACISRVTAHGGHKFRVTPGTKWCGDAGWSHVDFFPVLRSGTNIPAEKRVPICISFNKVGYYYRFENSVRGCMGKHRPTGTHWTHAHTIYTSRDATGQAYCVGMKEDREHTRWTMQKGDICSSDGFKHSFGFRAMRNDYTSPLAPCCILVALQFELGSKETPLQRFAAGKECESSSEWRVVYKLVLWSKPIGAEHHRMCLAAGSSEKVAEDGSAARDPHEVFRVFYDSACEKKSLVTFEGERKFYWTISTENLFLPETATGVHLCLCHVVLSKLASPQESVKKKDMPFYTWVESKCPRGAKKELCFNTLGPSDVLNAVHLVDEIV